MKININQIPAEGLTLKEEISPALLDLDTSIVKSRQPIKISADIKMINDVVMVDVVLDTSILMNCSRCLNDFECVFKKNLKLSCPIDKSEPVIDTSTSSLDYARDDPERAKRVEGSLSVNGQRSRTIDLNTDIRQEIILNYPMKPLCRVDCKGLCPKCGQNLNEGNCKCVSV